MSEGDYYLVTGVDITNTHRINFDDCYYVSKERYEMDDKIQLRVGDIIVTKDGTIGKIGIIDKLDKPATLNSHLFLIRNEAPNVLDTDYLFQILRSDTFQKFATNNTSGSNIPAFTQANISKFEIDLPPLQEQKKRSAILRSIDEKIINNSKISAELEGLAKTIYDYWFLQFEFPNEEGKPYKSSGGKMVYNEELKREIPEGWEVMSVKDIIKHINTGLNPRDNFVLNEGGDVRYITVKNLTIEGTIDFSGCDFITQDVKKLINKRSMIAKGDILFASIAPLGRCFLMLETPVDWEINESVFSIRPNIDLVSSVYLYMFFMSDWFIKKAEHSSTGSVFNGIRISVLEDTKIIVPPKNVMKDFTNRVSPALRKKYLSSKENEKLVSIRDWLLPMLMNGQITFKK
ncbi:MAG: restriction endonuclease subunit S [Erysipelotrichaceae bacterium]|nr:restriction endonuclease subunit S [Erysipelotrichaceae bacterium]